MEALVRSPESGARGRRCVADFDGDGQNEFCASGAGGKITVYKRQFTSRVTGNDLFPVIWQSEDLTDPELKPVQDGGREPSTFTQGLAVADIDGDGKNEILVGTSHNGRRPDTNESNPGKIHIFKYSRKNTFRTIWSSTWTEPASIPAFAVGDVDGDNLPEFVYRGMEVYSCRIVRTVPKNRGSIRKCKELGDRKNRETR